MVSRVAKMINANRYRDRNKAFATFNPGDLVCLTYHTKSRILTKNDKNKFIYRGRECLVHMKGDTGLFIGRHNGEAVLLIGEALCAISVYNLEKYKEQNGNVS